MPSFLKQDLNGLKIDFSSDKIVQSLMDEAFEPIVLGLIKVAVFIAVFVLFFGITGIIIHSIKKKNKDKSKNGKKKNFDKKPKNVSGEEKKEAKREPKKEQPRREQKPEPVVVERSEEEIKAIKRND